MSCCNRKRRPIASSEDTKAAESFFNSIRAGKTLAPNLLEGGKDAPSEVTQTQQEDAPSDTRPNKYGLVGIVKDALKGGAEKVSEEYASKRLRVCNACPHLFKLTSQCKKCGCFVKEKVKYAKERCPDGRW